MKQLSEFSINLLGLKEGVNQLEFRVERDFFAHFDGSELEDCEFDVKLEMEKRPALIVMDFSFSGVLKTDCDRCLEPIDLPIEGEQQFLLKFRDEPGEEDNVIFIPEHEPTFNIASLVFEIIQLGVPMRKVLLSCEKDYSRCDGLILEKLGKVENEEEEKNEGDEKSPWEELKKLKE